MPDFLPKISVLTLRTQPPQVSFAVAANGGLYSGIDFKATGKQTTTVAPTTTSNEEMSGAHSFYSPPRMRVSLAAFEHRRTRFSSSLTLLPIRLLYFCPVHYCSCSVCTRESEFSSIFLIACSTPIGVTSLQLAMVALAVAIFQVAAAC